MTFASTLIVLGLAGALCVFAGWMGARPPDLRRGPRMTPWRPIMVAAAVVAMLMLVHLLNLAGITTGRR
jgi:hypothetical protein